VAFFFASATASAGYLTVSEIFPLEMRAPAIVLFFSVATAVGGLGAPVLFGGMVEVFRKTGNTWPLSIGFFVGARLMIAAAAVEMWLGIDTERKVLEEVAAPDVGGAFRRRSRRGPGPRSLNQLCPHREPILGLKSCVSFEVSYFTRP
jgi:MFS family permease